MTLGAEKSPISPGDSVLIPPGTPHCVANTDAAALVILRLMGQLGLMGKLAPIRHPAKRRRLKTVLQEIMYRAAKFVAHARR